ncbi:MAG: T9SS type A sorting domain-containing protein [bacterium]|nr:T9SS type A sorting domain-containing protein [bacterium]
MITSEEKHSSLIKMLNKKTSSKMDIYGTKCIFLFFVFIFSTSLSNCFAQYSGWKVYNTSNSGLPNNSIYSLAIEGNVKWIGTYYGGLAKFDDTTWTVYYTSNSGLPYDVITALAIEGSAKWIGTWGGLAKFDGNTWTVYNKDNSELRDNWVLALAIEESAKWIGTRGGLAKFDGTNWTVYDTSNSGLPDNWVLALAIEESAKWIGTRGGLAKFDGANWTVYDTSNSGLPDNWVYSLAIEGIAKWIGTSDGLAVYNDSIIGIEEQSNLDFACLTGRQGFRSAELKIGQNPFFQSTVITYSITRLPAVGGNNDYTSTLLTIYDLTGRCIKTLVNELKPAGTYTTILNANELKTGIYFVQLNIGTFKTTKKLILMK